MSKTRQLVAEFKRITNEYNEALAALSRRHEIVLALVQEGRTHGEVAVLLGISTGRVAQLVKGAPGYVPQRITRPSRST